VTERSAEYHSPCWVPKTERWLVAPEKGPQLRRLAKLEEKNNVCEAEDQALVRFPRENIHSAKCRVLEIVAETRTMVRGIGEDFG
jgi:hypothetical protein